MKQKIAIMLAVLAICTLVSRSGADEQPARVMNFLAVMDLKCGTGIAKDQCAAFTDVLIDEMVRMKKYTVIDRANRDKILAEAGFQQSGCVDNSCTIEMGRQLGVGKMVVGSVAKLEETYLVNLQLLNVETSAVENSSRETCEKCKLDNLITTIANDARKLMGETLEQAPTPPPSAPPSPASPEEQKYIDTAKIANSGLFQTYQAGKAMLVFYRTKQNTLFGSLKIYFDGKFICNLPKGYYFYYEADPGVHELLIVGPIKMSFDIRLIAGKTIFLTLTRLRDLSILNPDTGLMEAKSCQYKAPEAGK